MESERVPHDQLFKELLRTFFREFMELFFPATAARLDFTSVVFLDKEVFTDVPEGALREPDVIARVQTVDGEPELILVHVEVQARRDREFGSRMLEYYMLLRLRFKLPVFPVVLYLERGAGGLGIDQYDELLFEESVLSFRYRRVGVPDLTAAEYLETENPLAYGLAALMRPGERHAAEVKAACLMQIARALIDEARKVLLANCVETYLCLDRSEELLFQQLMEQQTYEEADSMVSVYELRGALRAKREDVLRLLRHRFGDLPEDVETYVRSIETEGELNSLFDTALDAQSLAELGLQDNGQQ